MSSAQARDQQSQSIDKVHQSITAAATAFSLSPTTVSPASCIRVDSLLLLTSCCCSLFNPPKPLAAWSGSCPMGHGIYFIARYDLSSRVYSCSIRSSQLAVNSSVVILLTQMAGCFTSFFHQCGRATCPFLPPLLCSKKTWPACCNPTIAT